MRATIAGLWRMVGMFGAGAAATTSPLVTKRASFSMFAMAPCGLRSVGAGTILWMAKNLWRSVGVRLQYYMVHRDWLGGRVGRVRRRLWNLIQYRKVLWNLWD